MNAPAKPLRVLQVNSLFSGGGADNQTLELATGLRELGEEVMLAVPRGSPYAPTTPNATASGAHPCCARKLSDAGPRAG
jgi:hypothetical protein